MEVDFRQQIAVALSRTSARVLGKEKILQLLVFPPSPSMGEIAFPCFALAKEIKQHPLETAKQLRKEIVLPETVEKAVAVGPYLNFFLKKGVAAEKTIEAILKQKQKFGQAKKEKQTIMIEFFHANTHKAVHIGHIRNISLGESCCLLREAVGNKVIRVNYQGDIGLHVAKCVFQYRKEKSMEPKQRKGLWLSQLYIKAHEQYEKDPGTAKQIDELNKKIIAGDKTVMLDWKKTRQMCLKEFELLYRDFNVKFNRLYFESEAGETGKKIVLDGVKKGVFQENDGAIIADLKKYGLGVAVLINKFGNVLYHGKEFGLARLKQKEFMFGSSVHIVGKEQELYFKQFLKMLELLGDDFWKRTTHIVYNLVMLPQGKMSSRTGTVVYYEDLVGKLLNVSEQETRKRHSNWREKKVKETAKKIAFSAIKFSMLSVENNKSIVFDWEKAIDFEGSTGPYVMYAFVRASSILGKAKQKSFSKTDFSLLKEEEEKEIVALLSEFPEKVYLAAENYSPHIIVHFLLSLAGKFNSYYHKFPVLQAENKGLVQARLALVKSVSLVLENGLELLNIQTLEEM